MANETNWIRNKPVKDIGKDEWWLKAEKVLKQDPKLSWTNTGLASEITGLPMPKPKEKMSKELWNKGTTVYATLQELLKEGKVAKVREGRVYFYHWKLGWKSAVTGTI